VESYFDGLPDMPVDVEVKEQFAVLQINVTIDHELDHAHIALRTPDQRRHVQLLSQRFKRVLLGFERELARQRSRARLALHLEYVGGNSLDHCFTSEARLGQRQRYANTLDIDRLRSHQRRATHKQRRGNDQRLDQQL
jgi:hypothetical protein